MSGIVQYTPRLICCILSKRVILKHMHIKAMRIWQTKNIFVLVIAL